MKGNYIFRLFVYKILQMLPNNLADLVFYFMQKLFGQLGVEKYLESGKFFVNSIVNSKNFNGKFAAIEIGTGWYPVVPFILLDNQDSTEIFSYDLRNLMSAKNFQETCNMLNVNKNLYNRFHYKSGVNLVNYNFDEIELKNGEQLIVFSKATLQHIPYETIKAIHENLIKKFPCHRVFHLINCNDHRQHTDKKLSKYEFLKYNEEFWLKNCTRFDFHNRMRVSEYKILFKDLGYNIVNSECEKLSENQIELFNREILPFMDQRFRKFSTIENMSGSLFFELEIRNT